MWAPSGLPPSSKWLYFPGFCGWKQVSKSCFFCFSSFDLSQTFKENLRNWLFLGGPGGVKHEILLKFPINHGMVLIIQTVWSCERKYIYKVTHYFFTLRNLYMSTKSNNDNVLKSRVGGRSTISLLGWSSCSVETKNLFFLPINPL